MVSKRISLDGIKRNTMLLKQRGMPQDILRSRPFDLYQQTISINSELDGLKPRRIKKQKQIDAFVDLCNNPFGKPSITIIASTPNDLRAKMAAAYLMERALKLQLKGNAAHTKGRELPLWHTINGSFQDKIRDGSQTRPSMIVIGTMTRDSSNVKGEKLRDLLEHFNNIPRVVVVAGIDPISFANSKLFMAANYVLYLSQAKRVEL